MARFENKQIEQRTEIVKVTNSVEQWQEFERWVTRFGGQSLAEGFRSAMNKIVEMDCTLNSVKSQ